MTLLTAYAEFVNQSAHMPWPKALDHHARRAVLDWTGALVAGASAEPSQRLRRAYADEGQGGPASVAGTPQRHAVRAAAFLNGTISHVAEFDDIFRDGVYHPACPTISAIWPLAEQRQASLGQTLRAVVAGYEVSNRIARAIQPSHYQWFHTTGTVGVFGASAGAAAVLGLGAEAAAHAMAMAGTFASGLQQAFRSDAMSKPAHAGHAAEVGVQAALMAEAGMTGALDLLEGPAGLGAAMCDAPRWDQALDGLGQTFLIGQMTFKNHGCCGHNFAALDGLAHLMRTHGLRAQDLAAVRVGGYRATVEVCAQRHPRTPFEAKFSLSHTLACQALLGSVRERAVAPEQLGRADLQAFERLVSVTLDEDCDRAFPRQRSARVTVRLHDGRELVHHQHTRHGDPDDPLTDAELIDKFMELTSPRLGERDARWLVEAILERQDVTPAELAQRWARDCSI